jgi:PAS domain S-box-containing protein
MKLRTQFTILITVFCIIFLLIGTSAYYTNQQIAKIDRQEQISNNIVRGAYQLSYLSNDYLFHIGESRQNLQWESKFESLSDDISQLDVDTPEQLELVDQIKGNKQRLRDVYTQSVITIEAERRVSGTVDPELVQVAWSRFIVQNQGMIFDASQLSQLLHDESLHLQQRNTFIILSLMVVFLIILFTIVLFFNRRILGSISSLQDGIRIIGSGNLNYAIDESSNDEIGELSYAFNQMATNLKEITASKADLERVVAERKRVEEALLVKNTDLEAAYEEITATEEELRENYDELAKSQEALKQSEEKYQLIADNADDWIYWIAPDETLRYISPSCERVTGYSSVEFLENPQLLTGIVHPADRTFVQDHFSGIHEDGAGDYLEFRITTKNGEERWISHSCNPVYTHEGNYAGRRGTNRNITDRKHAEDDLLVKNTDLESAYEEITATSEEIRSLNEELEERVQQRTSELAAANKELKAFTYSVSHDLRAPLRAIHGFSKILMDEHAKSLSPEIRRYLTIINENGLRMGNLIDDLLAFSQTSRQPLNVQEVRPNEIISQCFAEMKDEQNGRSIEIAVADLPVCMADPALLKRVWFNLISNAIKFTRRRDIARITIGSREKTDGTVYFIQDNGAGFDMKYVGKLFGVFQRLHHADEFEGSGVGLAIVKMIVTRHGGTVWAEAEVEKGATFFFTLGKGDVRTGDGND